MTETGLAATRRTSDTTASVSVSPAELSWPPTSDDLNAIEVVVMPGDHEAHLVASPTASTGSMPFDTTGEYDLTAFSAEGTQLPATLVARRRQARVRRLLAVAVCLVVALALGRTFWPLTALDVVLSQRQPATSGTPESTQAPPEAVSVDAASDAIQVSAGPARAGGVLASYAAAPTARQPELEVAPPASRPPNGPLEVSLSQRVATGTADPDLHLAPAALAPPPGTPLAPAAGKLATDAPALASTVAGVGPVPPALVPRPTATDPAATLPSGAAGISPSLDAPASPVPLPGASSEELRVQAALRRYEAAYTRLDARAAQAVWPSVDARALARAFDGLDSQSLQFDRCEFGVQGTTASAECRGRATYVRRVGSRTPRTEARTWNFTLRKVGDEWLILRADIR